VLKIVAHSRIRYVVNADRSGYVLLLVIVTIVIAATALVQLANRSLVEHGESLRANQELQTKWGRLSCEQAILPSAEAIFEVLDRSRDTTDRKKVVPIWRLRQSTILGKQRFDLLLADESAKASVAGIYRASNREARLTALRDLVPPRLQIALRVNIGSNPSVSARESPASDKNTNIPLGTVVNLAVLDQAGGRRQIVEFLEKLTVWGDGPLNLHRAPDDCILAVCQAVVPKERARRLIKTYRDSGPVEVEVLLQRVVKNESERLQLRRLLTDASFSYSLWTETVSPQGGYSLGVGIRSLDEAGKACYRHLAMD
jgi:cell division protein FtsL